MNRARRLWTILLTIGALGAAAGGLWLHRSLFVDAEPLGEEVRVQVPQGASLRRAAEILVDADLLKAPWLLRLASRLEGGDRSLRAGHYELQRGLAPASLLARLVEGDVMFLDITLLEGWTATQMAGVLADSLDLDPVVLAGLVQSPPQDWRRRLDLSDQASLEGYLFPETYRFILGLAPRSVIQTLVGSLEAAWSDSMTQRSEELGLSRHEVLTLASIVEAEAQLPAERRLVAAVYHNRLRKGMRLEADPTVAYATGVSGEDLRYSHLQADSPYNTYRNAGLPPGPINCPGLAAIRAALWPQEDFDALYFVSDGTGGHRFSRTWKEHVEAVQDYRAIQRRRRALRAGSDGEAP